MSGSTFFAPVPMHAIPALLQDHGISPTAQRVKIAGLLLAKRQHVSADGVLKQLGSEGAAVSKATVYNTLGLFAERGLLREVIIDPSRVFYDTNVSPHHHFFNVDDGTLIDIDDVVVDISQLPAAPSGTRTESVDIVIRISNKS